MPPDLAARLERVRGQMRAAAEGSAGQAVTLVAASKFQPLASVEALFRLGVQDFGENYPQALAERAAAWADAPARPRWHLLGGLQRNKAALVAPVVDVVHSVDCTRVAEALSVAWQRASRDAPIEVYLQVRLGDGPAARRGIDAAGVAGLAVAVRRLPGLVLVGLMGLPAAGDEPVPAFRFLAALGRRLQAPGGPLVGAAGLSMGMSDDFSLAIAEGATVVRIGSALFGSREKGPVA